MFATLCTFSFSIQAECLTNVKQYISREKRLLCRWISGWNLALWKGGDSFRHWYSQTRSSPDPHCRRQRGLIMVRPILPGSCWILQALTPAQGGQIQHDGSNSSCSLREPMFYHGKTESLLREYWGLKHTSLTALKTKKELVFFSQKIDFEPTPKSCPLTSTGKPQHKCMHTSPTY